MQVTCKVRYKDYSITIIHRLCVQHSLFITASPLLNICVYYRNTFVRKHSSYLPFKGEKGKPMTHSMCDHCCCVIE